MPIFEYTCESCDKRFELIQQSSTVAECPTCKGRELKKALSVFAVGGTGGSSGPSPAAMMQSGGGGCGNCATEPHCSYRN